MKTLSITFAFFLLLTTGLLPSCTENTGTEASSAAAEPITINGTVTAITLGKDGYTAEVLTDAAGTYSALVSIVNLGGRENFKPCNLGDKVSFKGIPSILGDAQQLKVTEIISIEPGRTQMVIGHNSFRGITIGELISNHKEYIQKTQLKTGDGTFEVYQIKDFENNPAGYFLPDPNAADRVGDIVVQTPKAQTAEGIMVGSTYEDLLKVFPSIEVHGSEVEGRTNATNGSLSYRLDVPNFTYEVDKAKIPVTTKIVEITINRAVAGK
ncbi:MAG: hypothetical protein IT258_00730 [Saprospiraceae bacterium]|nr:hypothetical protein [Saprospiraceae bacterium]